MSILFKVTGSDFKKGKASFKHGLRTKSPNVKILVDPKQKVPTAADVTFNFPDGETAIMTITPEIIAEFLSDKCWCVTFSKGDE